MAKQESVDIDLEWIGGKQSEARVRQFTVSIDNPKESGGGDTGPRPTELLLSSLGSCFIIGFARIAEEMRINLKRVRLSISGVKEGGETPRFTHITISIQPEVENNYWKIPRLKSLAEKYCTVANTLKNKTKISFRIHSPEQS